MVLEAQAPSSDGFSAPLNLDGTAFRLRWKSKSTVEPSDLKNLPAMDYALVPVQHGQVPPGRAVRHHRRSAFPGHLRAFPQNPLETAQTQQLWFIEYLLILAFGKAFMSPSNQSAPGPPGSEYAGRAMALLPDAAQLHDEHMVAIEVVSLVALYFHSIDMRMAAYQYVRALFQLLPEIQTYRVIQIGQAYVSRSWRNPPSDPRRRHQPRVRHPLQHGVVDHLCSRPRAHGVDGRSAIRPRRHHCRAALGKVVIVARKSSNPSDPPIQTDREHV